MSGWWVGPLKWIAIAVGFVLGLAVMMYVSIALGEAWRREYTIGDGRSIRIHCYTFDKGGGGRMQVYIDPNDPEWAPVSCRVPGR